MSLHQSAAYLLDQIDLVISQLSDEQYSQQLAILSQASIGQHVRHTVEFFLCLIEGRNEGVLNYDNRRRDSFIEQEILSARNVIVSIKNFLNNNQADRPLTMHADYSVESGELVAIPSTFYRELAYNIEHTIHHMALIKIGLRNVFDHVKLPDHFGVASSTVRYQLQQTTE